MCFHHLCGYEQLWLYIMFRTWTLTPSFCAFSLSSGVCMPYVWHRRFPMKFLVGKKFCSCEGGNTKWNKGTAWEQLTQRVTDNERVEVEVWWMMMDDRGQGEKKKKKKNNLQIQNADRWRCHAFLKTVVWPCQRDRPVEEGGILPVYRHRLGLCHPSWKAPGTPVLQLQTKLRSENI